jgi:hypothetical protein
MSSPAPALGPGATPAAVVVPLLILAHAAEASKEKEAARGSTSATEASKEKGTARGSTTAATSGDSFLGEGGAVPGAGTTSAVAPEDPKV